MLFYLFITRKKMRILSVVFCSCFPQSQGLTFRRMTVLPPDGFGPSQSVTALIRQLKPTTCTVPVQRRLGLMMAG
jgi:hypothetical protein